MLLSIIIPYYKTLELTKQLLDKLIPQLTSRVEVLLIDDGCNEKELDNLKARVIHLEKNSGNASKPRNNGEPPKWNCSVWCRVYKKEIIGKTRFREDLNIAEDWAFNQEIKYKTSCSIKKQIYFYNSKRKGSLTRR